MTRVLFVCLGNICRSPMAEAVFKDYAAKNGLAAKFHFESRATSNWEQGNPVHPGTMDILKKYNITFKDKKSQRITERDFLEYDYIIGMDKNNLKFLKNFEEGYYKHKVYPFIKRKDVPDPYYTGDFDETYELLTKHMDRWFKLWLEDTKSR